MTTPRKRTVFLPCEAHAAQYATESRARRAEAMVEGGWYGYGPCMGGTCQMRPGTDFYNADFVTANAVYTVAR
jgi:hypothetical protein